VPTPHALEIVLTADERAELEGWARRRTSAAGLAVRSRIVLAAADGGSNTELSQRLGLAIGTVRRWRNRFAELGLDGLVDEPRPGRPRVVTLTPILSRRYVHRELTPPCQCRNDRLRQVGAGCRARRTRIRSNAGHCRRDYTVDNMSPIGPSSWEDVCDADGELLPAR
jgi:DNA-binding CsgD family transcriptional regulator